jgi:hypothetical protein
MEEVCQKPPGAWATSYWRERGSDSGPPWKSVAQSRLDDNTKDGILWNVDKRRQVRSRWSIGELTEERDYLVRMVSGEFLDEILILEVGGHCAESNRALLGILLRVGGLCRVAVDVDDVAEESWVAWERFVHFVGVRFSLGNFIALRPSSHTRSP